MTVRKPTAASLHPMVPHFHICRACEPRHKWRCENTTCEWSLYMACDKALDSEAQV